MGVREKTKFVGSRHAENALSRRSSIRAIGYNEKASELWIEFHSSPDFYVYFEVPPAVHAELEAAHL